MRLKSLLVCVTIAGWMFTSQFVYAAANEAPEKSKTDAPSEKAGDTEKIGPRIEFDEKVHDFGDIPPKSKKDCRFRFKNTGDEVLKIGKIRTTCGCTVAKLDKKEYRPDESGVIGITYRAGSRPHHATKRIYVPTNDSDNSKVALTIKARIIEKVACSPDDIRLFPRKENAGCPKISITSKDGKAFSIKGYTATGHYLKADIDPAVKATKFIIQPTVDVNKLSEGRSGVIKFTLTHPDCDSVSVPFRVVPEYTIKPPSIFILRAEPNKPENKTVWVLNNYDEPFEVETAKAEEGIIEVVDTKKVLNKDDDASRYKFDLKITPPKRKKFESRRFSDTLHVKIKGGKELKVRCNGFFFPKKSQEILEQAKGQRRPERQKAPTPPIKHPHSSPPPK